MLKDDVLPVIEATHTDLNENDNSWDTDMAERNAPLDRYFEELFPLYPVNDAWVNKEEWLDDIKHCLKQEYVRCHQCKEWVRKKYYKHRGRQVAGCHW
jgi:hypothetical protein